MRLYLLFLFFVNPSAFGVPKWALSDTQKKDGNFLKVVCSGQGPSIDIARGESIQGCKNSSAVHLSNKISIRTTAIETEKDTSFHQEATSSGIFKNLNCKPIKEEVEVLDGSSYRVWTMCEFDLSKAKAEADTDNKKIASPNNSKSNFADSQEESSNSSNSIKLGKNVESEARILTLVLNSPCDDILVKGALSRRIKCTENPISIPIQTKDSEIIIRASGYQPKALKFQEGSRKDETLQIFLRPI